MRIKIRTTDTQWTADHAESVTDGIAIVSVPAKSVERLTFANREMIRFDLRVIGKRIPRDWGNAAAMLPASYVVSGR